jgi:Pentapeptide repeats (8 copies)
MLVRDQYPRPRPWAEHKTTIAHPWTTPLHNVDWMLRWLAYYLSRWALLEVLEYLGTFSVLIAVIFYFSESGDRKKQKHYQAWQVINTAQGKGGNGGRIEALQELNEDHVPLVGVDASGAFLQGVRLRKASLFRCDLDGSDLRDSVLASAQMELAHLNSANFRNSDLQGANLRKADMTDADLTEANLAGADLTGLDLTNADMRSANLKGVRWQNIKAIENANVYGVRNAPAGFVEWALKHKAISRQIDEQ